MSIITFRDGVVAADQIVVCGTLRVPGETPKIVQMKDGRVAGACGRASFCEAFLLWAKNKRKKKPEVHSDSDGADIGMIFSKDGSIEIYSDEGTYTINTEYYAAGMGEGVAYGAFWKDATAEEACRAVIHFEIHTGGEPTVIDMRD